MDKIHSHGFASQPVQSKLPVSQAAAAPASAPPAKAPKSPAASPAKDSVQTSSAGKASAQVGFVEEPPAQSPAERLKHMKSAELKQLGKTNKPAFFAALLPAALDSERKYGVPAEVILAQAALESGWGKHAIGGFNIFGIKGSGPAGTVKLATHEGSGKASMANFAKFNNFHEAVVEHGEMYNNGSYTDGMKAYAKNKDPFKFVDQIAGVYATAPDYASKVKRVMRDYGLHKLAEASRRHTRAD